LRIILRLTSQEVELLEKRQQETGLSRTEMIRRAIDHYWSEKRHETNWEPPKR
jgi:metal-responsive CopG/Arc/MetJ family transcriptional regulator